MATTVKNTWNSTVKLSTTNIPPNVDR